MRTASLLLTVAALAAWLASAAPARRTTRKPRVFAHPLHEPAYDGPGYRYSETDPED